MRELIGKRPWLTVFRFPTYTPDLNPAEGVRAHLTKSLRPDHRTDYTVRPARFHMRWLSAFEWFRVTAIPG